MEGPRKTATGQPTGPGRYSRARVVPVHFLHDLRRVARQGRQYGPGAAPRRGSHGPILIPIPGTWGSSDSPWSGSSGGFSGGFSGGGGSFGGGGASGSW